MAFVVITTCPSVNFGLTPDGSRLKLVMAVLLADNQAVRLFGSAGKTTAAALTLTLDCCALLSCGDAVAIAFKHFLGNPADDGSCILRSAFKLLRKLLLKRFDV